MITIAFYRNYHCFFIEIVDNFATDAYNSCRIIKTFGFCKDGVATAFYFFTF